MTAPRYQDLQALIDEVNYLEDSLLVGMPSSGPAPLAVAADLMPAPIAELMQNGWPSVEQLEAVCHCARQTMPGQLLNFNLYGPEEVVRATWAAIQRRFSDNIPGVSFPG